MTRLDLLKMLLAVFGFFMLTTVLFLAGQLNFIIGIIGTCLWIAFLPTCDKYTLGDIIDFLRRKK